MPGKVDEMDVGEAVMGGIQSRCRVICSNVRGGLSAWTSHRSRGKLRLRKGQVTRGDTRPRLRRSSTTEAHTSVSCSLVQLQRCPSVLLSPCRRCLLVRPLRPQLSTELDPLRCSPSKRRTPNSS